MSLITPDSGLIIWMTLIFGVVFFVLAKFGFPVITKGIDARSRGIEKSLRDAETARKELSELSEKQQELLLKTREEQTLLLKEASAVRDSIISGARAEAEKQAAEIIAAAREQIVSERDAALGELRSTVADLSCRIAEKVVGSALEQSDVRESVISGMLEGMSDQNPEA